MIAEEHLRDLGKVLRVLNDGLPQAPGLNVRNIAAYAMALDGLPMNAIRAGVLRILRTWDMATIMPPPAVVRKATLAEIAEHLGLPSAEDAWAEVRHKIMEYGTRGMPLPGGGYGPIKWSHHVVELAVDAIGGVKYLSASDNVPTDRAHWLKQIYPAMVENWQKVATWQLTPGTAAALLERGMDGNTED